MLVWRMPHTTADIVLTGDERSALESLACTGRGRADLARRARIILRLAAGDLYSNFNESSRTIAKWKQRFLEARIAGLDGRYPGSTATVLTPQLEARILAKTREQPPDGSTQWSTRSLANALKLKTHTYVQRTWERAGLKPHRIERYMRSTDPEFETKAADVIGLYMAPPQHAAVFCLDEKTAIQALDRLDPVLPLSPGRLERHGFEYRRNGTLSLYAALNTQSGKVQGKTAERHTSAAFIAFLEQLVSTCKTRQEIHIILDNLSAHKTAKVAEFLARNPNVKLHFTPTYSSWLNQVEIWFSRLEREVIARGIFTSVNDLARKLMRYIRAYSKTARPFKWKYSDVRRKILPC